LLFSSGFNPVRGFGSEIRNRIQGGQNALPRGENLVILFFVREAAFSLWRAGGVFWVWIRIRDQDSVKWTQNMNDKSSAIFALLIFVCFLFLQIFTFLIDDFQKLKLFDKSVESHRAIVNSPTTRKSELSVRYSRTVSQNA
jgi:hypothetical protein